MPVKKTGVLSPRLFADHGIAAMGFPMIANVALTITSMSTKFYSEY
jgi:hypothetical protein